jgi:carbon storage regulator CsrA
MLVLSRQLGESVMVGDGLQITLRTIVGRESVVLTCQQGANKSSVRINLDETAEVAGIVNVSLVLVKDNGKVRLGFEADKAVKIHRQEVYDAINKH